MATASIGVPASSQSRRAVSAAVIGDTPMAPVWCLIAAAIVSFCVIWSLKETAHDELARC